MKYNLNFYGGLHPNLKWCNNRCWFDSFMQQLYVASEMREFILRTEFNNPKAEDLYPRRNINKNMNQIKLILSEMKKLDKPNNQNTIINDERLNLPCFTKCTTPWELVDEPVNSAGNPSDILIIIEKILNLYGYMDFIYYRNKENIGQYIYKLYTNDNTLNNMDYNKFNDLIKFNFSKDKFTEFKQNIIGIISLGKIKSIGRTIGDFIKNHSKLEPFEYNIVAYKYDYKNGIENAKPKYIYLSNSNFLIEKPKEILEFKNINYKLISFSIVYSGHVTAYIYDKETNSWYFYDDNKHDKPYIVKKNIDEIKIASNPYQNYVDILYCYELQKESVIDTICKYII